MASGQTVVKSREMGGEKKIDTRGTLHEGAASQLCGRSQAHQNTNSPAPRHTDINDGPNER